GYEATTTAAICRLAGTSQSQLIKHFTNKQGVLEAIFEYAWEQLNPAVQLAIERNPSPTQKLRTVVDMALSFLQKDRDLRTIFLLEGRRIRGDGHMVVDRKSTRLNSSHGSISYAVFCLKKKKKRKRIMLD